ncbi:hypothetical protein [Streptomyces sp. NPDC006132]|uniref:hypothetical protein n=1 Tax=Streptomyces sp. NPDC006132 TaxID=3156732 RepID=UPI0033EE9EB8
MTREERRAYVRSVVDAAPALTAEDADLLRALIPMEARLAAQRGPVKREPRRNARQSAA